MSRVAESPEVLFLRGYKDAIMHFNMLDRNFAYCLRWAASQNGTEADVMTFLSRSYERKLKKIISLIGRAERMSEYDKFLTLAERCRTQRNKLVHGHWEFVAHHPKPIIFHVPAPFEERGYLTQNEFLDLVSPFEAANSLFCALREKYPIEYPVVTVNPPNPKPSVKRGNGGDCRQTAQSFATRFGQRMRFPAGPPYTDCIVRDVANARGACKHAGLHEAILPDSV